VLIGCEASLDNLFLNETIIPFFVILNNIFFY